MTALSSSNNGAGTSSRKKRSSLPSPLWIKFPNLPLCCWTEKGLSRIASRVGIPLAVDKLTASQARLTFARVCVLVSPSTTLPSTVAIDLNGKKFQQRVLYDWKPSGCSTCSSFSHNANSCPLLPAKAPLTRGRSRSRQARNSNPSRPPPPARQNETITPTGPQTTSTLNPMPDPPIGTPPSLSNLSNIPLTASAAPQSNPHIELYDLNLLPVLSPPPDQPAEPTLPISSTESLEVHPPPLPSPPQALTTAMSSSPGHSHALRSLDTALKSPLKDTANSSLISQTSVAAQTKGKKKGKK